MKSLTVVLVLFVALVFSHPTEEERKRNVEEKRVNVKSHPTVKCEHITPEKGEHSGDNHRACSSHCRSLEAGREEGKCVHGMCHCEYKGESHGEEVHPTVKCLDLVPDHGKPHSDNHEACESHCNSLDNGYRKGECSKGICHCYLHE